MPPAAPRGSGWNDDIPSDPLIEGSTLWKPQGLFLPSAVWWMLRGPYLGLLLWSVGLVAKVMFLSFGMA